VKKKETSSQGTTDKGKKNQQNEVVGKKRFGGACGIPGVADWGFDQGKQPGTSLFHATRGNRVSSEKGYKRG